MGGVPSFDTAEYAGRLTTGGVDTKAARAHRIALTGAIDEMRDQLVTKSDLQGGLQSLETTLTWKLLGGVGAIVGLFTGLNALVSAVAAGLIRLR